MNNILLLDPYIIEREGPVPPVVWNIDIARRLRYEDIKEDRYEEAIDFLISDHFPYETLSRCVRLPSDADSLGEMVALMRFLLRDECSMAAIDERTDRICGVAIMKIMQRADWSWPFWRLLGPRRDGSGCESIVGFQCEFMKYSKRLHQQLDTECTVHLFAVANARERKGDLLKEQLLLQTYRLARSVGATACTWIATSRNDQERALRVGMRYIDQMNYGHHRDDKGRVVFERLDAGEHHAGMYGWQCAKGKVAMSLGDYLFPEYAAEERTFGRRNKAEQSVDQNKQPVSK